MNVEQSDSQGAGQVIAGVAVLVGLENTAIIAIAQDERRFISQDVDDPTGDALVSQGLAQQHF